MGPRIFWAVAGPAVDVGIGFGLCAYLLYRIVRGTKRQPAQAT